MTDTLSPLDQLRVLIAADEALQDRLAAAGEVQEMSHLAVEVAAAAGIALSAEEIRAATRFDPVGLDQYVPTPPNFARPPGRHWLPVALAQTMAGPAVDWRHFGEARLKESFFQDTVHWSRGQPLSNLLKVRTPLSALLELGAAPDAATPDALIFHMSRCGSTLVSQMIAAMPGSIVASEAAPLDAMLLLCLSSPQIPIEQQVALIRGMAAALGRDRFGDRRRFVIKTDSWHSLGLPLLRAAFPETPWLFLFRDPVEVMVSQMRMRGSQAVPGLGPDALYAIDDPLSYSAEDYTAMVLAKVCTAAIDHAPLGGGLFVDYADLPQAVEERILPHFGIDPDAEGLAALRAASGQDAKNPKFSFTADGEGKRREANEDVQRAVATHLADVHRRLTGLAADR